MPNAIVIMSSGHNPFYSEPYMSSYIDTDAMKALAGTGTLFENAYCVSPLTVPSRASWMLGRYPHQTQVYSNAAEDGGEDMPTFARALGDQDVHTVHIGTVGCHTPAESLGFSELIKPIEREREPLADVHPDAKARMDDAGPRDDAFDIELGLMQAAQQWLADHKQDDKQWVMCLNLPLPAAPLHVNTELWEKYDRLADQPLYGQEGAPSKHPYAQAQRRYFQTESLTPEQNRRLRRAYYGRVEWLDLQIGKILAAVKEHGLADTTNVIYTADHGLMLGLFDMWWDGTLYEHCARVPMIAAGPDFEATKVIRTPVTLLDLQATLFDITGTERPDDWPGRSLRGLPSYDRERVIFSELHGPGAPGAAYLIRRGDWKLIHYTDAENQLFHLIKDPNELRNAFETQSGRAKEMEQELRKIVDPDREHQRALDAQKRQRDAAD